MLAHEAFDYILEEYKISAKEISELSGIDKSVISRFRNGHTDISTNRLQKLIQSLPPQAKAHFYMLFSFNTKEEKVS